MFVTKFQPIVTSSSYFGTRYVFPFEYYRLWCLLHSQLRIVIDTIAVVQMGEVLHPYSSRFFPAPFMLVALLPNTLTGELCLHSNVTVLLT